MLLVCDLFNGPRHLSPIHLHDGEQHPACAAGYRSYVLTCSMWAAGGGSPAAGGVSPGEGVEYIRTGQLQVSLQLDELAQLGGPMLRLLV